MTGFFLSKIYKIMATKTVTMAVSCKHCGGTVIIEKQLVTETTNQSGGITSKMCPKCHKNSQYNYTMKEGQFTDLR